MILQILQMFKTILETYHTKDSPTNCVRNKRNLNNPSGYTPWQNGRVKRQANLHAIKVDAFPRKLSYNMDKIGDILFTYVISRILPLPRNLFSAMLIIRTLVITEWQQFQTGQ